MLVCRHLTSDSKGRTQTECALLQRVWGVKFGKYSRLYSMRLLRESLQSLINKKCALCTRMSRFAGAVEYHTTVSWAGRSCHNVNECFRREAPHVWDLGISSCSHFNEYTRLLYDNNALRAIATRAFSILFFRKPAFLVQPRFQSEPRHLKIPFAQRTSSRPQNFVVILLQNKTVQQKVLRARLLPASPVRGAHMRECPHPARQRTLFELMYSKKQPATLRSYCSEYPEFWRLLTTALPYRRMPN